MSVGICFSRSHPPNTAGCPISRAFCEKWDSLREVGSTSPTLVILSEAKDLCRPDHPNHLVIPSGARNLHFCFETFGKGAASGACRQSRYLGFWVAQRFIAAITERLKSPRADASPRGSIVSDAPKFD